MKELFVGPIIEKLVDFAFDHLQDQARWQTDMKEDLERLRNNLPQIQAVVDYTSSQVHIKDPALNRWLWQLQAAIDEADDVLDEIEYRELQEQLTKEKTKKRKLSSLSADLHFMAYKAARQVCQSFLKNDPTLKRLEEVVQKLVNVSADFATFLQLANEEKEHTKDQLLRLSKARETGSTPTSDLIGRGKEKEDVMMWLRNPSNEYQASNQYRSTFFDNISLLSIVGQGGIGKTTLLQHVYKEEIDEFDLKLWICVSNNFNMKKFIEDMLESLTNKRPCLETLDVLQKNLESMVKTKKFLLVLDDIWEEEDEDQNKSQWEKVFTPLASGKLGSKILVTTRLESVALMFSNIIKKKNNMLRLEGLEKDDCLLLLKRRAFANAESLPAFDNSGSIFDSIVEKLCGSPLAANVIGDDLSSNLDKINCESFSNYDIGRHKSIMENLKLSYVFLPKVLQNCLSFYCIFPQDHMPLKDDLVRMWIALGFIQPSTNPGETMKDVGERYYNTLVKKSIFDKFQSGYRTCFKLHDLLYQMIRAVSTQQCFSIVDDKELQSPETIRHLFVKTSHLSVLTKVEKIQNLRSIILFDLDDHEDFIGVLTKVFKNLKRIRLMYIDALKLKEMPKEIKDLMHIRYLKIFNISTLTLPPKSLSNLFHLQFMICKQCSDNRRGHDILPNDVNNLPNLHYLEVPFPGMYEIGKLNSLKELDGFYVQNKDGYRIEELQHMNELRVLKINFDENLNSAETAKLCDKKKLIDLSLQWDHNNADASLNENVLDTLKPHNSLKKLKIDSFMGVSPAWMNCINLFSKLEYIKLKDCLNWQTLPPFWKLPALKYLYLYNMPQVKRFDYTFHGNEKVVFRSLQVLHIEKFQALEDLFVATAAAYECLFPCLIELHLLSCPKLQELPSLPPKLTKLEIRSCHPELKECYHKDTGYNWHKIAHIPDINIYD